MIVLRVGLILDNYKTTECLRMKGVLDSIDNDNCGEEIIRESVS